MRKIVGIVCKYVPKTERVLDVASDELRQALMDVGVLPIGIFPNRRRVNLDFPSNISDRNFTVREYDLLINQLSICDGVVFQGGQGIADYEYDMARFCFQENIPTLGICSGQTVVAGIFGLKATEVVGVDPAVHRLTHDKYAHSCEVVPGTMFSDIVGVQTMRVNSRHTHAICKCDNLTVSAVDCDGNAEVVEAEDKKFYLGVRFHPESLYLADARMKAIFKAFAHSL